jgi:hypothetical protein
MNCENCGIEHSGTYGTGRFCQSKCARSFSTKSKRQEINQKVSSTMIGKKFPDRKMMTPDEILKLKKERKRSSYVAKVESSSILDVSSRTARKIILRMKLPCTMCGWYVDGVGCDIHHIIPRADGGSNDHSNLAYICPNCHRLVHSGIIKSADLVSFQDIVGDDWKQFYFTKYSSDTD